ncbi:hypothetical protein DL96DRAFT_1563392 [Flagelloscypha sp. PMI_526]|nr:hypothetical protein DL96DRAFT_1563392 [Flagelloscypha sp. PMI_526]
MSASPKSNILHREALRISDSLNLNTLGVDKDILQIFTSAVRHNTIFPFFSLRSVNFAEEEIQRELLILDQAIQGSQMPNLVLTKKKAFLESVRQTLKQSVHSWSPFPALPIEVVQYIFELAAETPYWTRVALSMVSKQIQLLYVHSERWKPYIRITGPLVGRTNIFFAA